MLYAIAKATLEPRLLVGSRVTVGCHQACKRRWAGFGDTSNQHNAMRAYPLIYINIYFITIPSGPSCVLLSIYIYIVYMYMHIYKKQGAFGDKMPYYVSALQPLPEYHRHCRYCLPLRSNPHPLGPCLNTSSCHRSCCSASTCCAAPASPRSSLHTLQYHCSGSRAGLTGGLAHA
jgi:hypothetical protein